MRLKPGRTGRIGRRLTAVLGIISVTALTATALTSTALADAAAVAAPAAHSNAAPGTGYGPADAMHVQVTGDATTGLAAQIYDGGTFVSKRGMDGTDLTATPLTIGPNLATSDQTGGLDWQGPVEASVGTIPGTITPATLPDGTSAVHWVQPAEANQTWIYYVPSGIVQGDTYSASITVQGTGSIYFNFYNGKANNTTGVVNLSSNAPQTFTINQLAIPTGTQTATPRLQVEEQAGAGPLDLYVSDAVVQQVTAGTPEALQNNYTTASYDQRSRTLTLSGAVSMVGSATVTRSETYRFVNSKVIDASLRVSATGPVEVYFSAYTDFPSTWQFLSPDGPATSLDTATSPLPILGASDGDYIYGVASGSTAHYPLPGYNTPHLVISGSRLAAPQIGSRTAQVMLGTGGSSKTSGTWRTVFFRSAPSTYGFELAGEAAMAEALGFTRQNSPGIGSVPPGADPTGSNLPDTELPQLAAADLGLISRATSYWLELLNKLGDISVTPSMHYAPNSWMRDSFFTDMALTGDTKLGNQAETALMNRYTGQTTAAGRVPLTVGGVDAWFNDESGVLYLIRLYRDLDVLHLKVGGTATMATAATVLSFINTNQVIDGAFNPGTGGGGQTYGSWLDGYLYPPQSVNGYDQGLYVVALTAAQRLGLPVTGQQIAQAEAAYKALWDPQAGYVRWLSGTTDKSPDVLVGDAMSLYLFNRPLLPAREVISTLNTQTWTPYGMEVLAQQDGSFLPASDFSAFSGIPGGAGDPGGVYQNGGSWFLWEYLAEYAAYRQGDHQAASLMARSAANEVAVTPMSKEFKLTAADSAYPYPLGSSELIRQGYGWNTAYVAFALSLRG